MTLLIQRPAFVSMCRKRFYILATGAIGVAAQSRLAIVTKIGNGGHAELRSAPNEDSPSRLRDNPTGHPSPRSTGMTYGARAGPVTR